MLALEQSETSGSRKKSRQLGVVGEEGIERDLEGDMSSTNFIYAAIRLNQSSHG